MSKFGAPSLKNISEYAAHMKTFFKRAYLRLFWGLTSLYLVNVQPNQTLSPHQNFLDPLVDVGWYVNNLAYYAGKYLVYSIIFRMVSA